MDASKADLIDYQITWLAMTERPKAPPPPRPANIETALIGAHRPPADYFLYLYRAVGAAYQWTDWLDRPRAELESFVHNPEVRLYTCMVEGWPGGFFMLDTRESGICDLAYFGLVPQAVGRGLGSWLLGTAIRMGWERPGVARLTVNTCTLDHPAALGLYQRLGFEPHARERRSRRPGCTDVIAGASS